MAKKNIGTMGKKAAKKKAVKKPAKKSSVKKSKVKKERKYGSLVILVLVLLAVSAVYINWDTISNITENSKEQVAATVNGEVITLSEIEDIYIRLPEQTRSFITKEDLLEQVINERILIQDATSKGIKVLDEEVSKFIDTLLIQSGLTEEEFYSRMDAQNISNDMVVDEIKKQLIIQKLYQQEILDNIEVPDQELITYYQQNLEQFEVQEQVKASHILICHTESTLCESNLTKQKALDKANEVLKMVTDDNFAELAVEFSMGPSGPNGGDLGFFGRGVMVSQFEDAAFSTEVGEVTGPVETSFGYHIIQVTDKIEASTKPFEEVKDEIKLSLVPQNQQDAFKNYLDSLKEEAEIVNFFEQGIVVTTK